MQTPLEVGQRGERNSDEQGDDGDAGDGIPKPFEVVDLPLHLEQGRGELLASCAGQFERADAGLKLLEVSEVGLLLHRRVYAVDEAELKSVELGPQSFKGNYVVVIHRVTGGTEGSLRGRAVVVDLHLCPEIRVAVYAR